MSGIDSRLPKVDLRRLAAIGLWTLLLLCILLNSAGVFAIDTKPEIYWAPGRSTELFSQPWQPSPQLGWPNFNVGLTPVPAFVWLLHVLGLDPTFSVRVLRLLLYTVGAFGVARLIRVMRSAPRSGWPELIGAAVFVANPYAVVGGATNAILLPMALLPWLSITYLRALRSPSRWRWPAAFALVFFLMTGQNAGVVALLQLLVLPVIIWYVRREDGTSWRRIGWVSLRSGALAVLVSSYWLVPSVIATTQGVSVLQNSESLAGINATSSLAESLRGLGFWAMYGGDANGPWQPGFASYLMSPIVVVLSFGITLVLVLAALGTRSRARLPFVVLALSSVVLMSGLYPFPSGSLFGRFLGWLFTAVPATGAFRTLYKTGPLLVLAIALLAGLAAASWVPRKRKVVVRGATGLAVLVVAAGSVWPALSGGLYPRVLPIPEYWQQAGAAASQGPNDQRVWLAPGEFQSDYTWAPTQPDDLALPLVSRPTVLRTTLPIASPTTSNFLAAVDTALQRDQLVANSMSRAARIMGASQVLVRNDTRWANSNGARPSTIAGQSGGDQGLGEPRGFGRPGQNVFPTPDGRALGESALPPVQIYPVKDPIGIVRAESPRGMNLVVGDGFSLTQLSTAGLADKGQAFRYVADLAHSEFVSLLGSERRLVLTDSNRRRDSNLNWLINNQGPLLAQDTALGSSRTLFDTADQTVLRVDGGGSAAATMVGSTFGVLPDAAAENVNDGDPRTSWQFGDFGTAVGQSITVTLDHGVALPKVIFTQPDLGPVSIARVRVTFAGKSTDANVATVGPTEISLPLGHGNSVTVEVLTTRGQGFNLVGISELGIPDLRLQRVAVMPHTLQVKSEALDEAARTKLRATPVDVLMQRQGAVPGGGAEEARLLRDFEVPTERTYRTYGLLRPGPNIDDVTYDQATGRGGPVSAHGSTRYADDLAWRGSQAFDGNTKTAWIPADGSVSSLTVRGPAQMIDQVRLTQPAAAWADLITLRIDGQFKGQFKVAQGTSTLRFPRTSANEVEFQLDSRAGSPVVPLAVAEVGVGNWRVATKPVREQPCLDVGTLDGKPLLVRPLSTVPENRAALFANCLGDISLASGTHTLRNNFDWLIDTQVFRDTGGEVVVEPGPVPTVTAATSWGPRYSVEVGAATEPYFLVLANSSDSRWRNSAAAGDRAEPIVIDGMANGWPMPPGQGRTLELSFASEPAVTVSWVISGVGILVCLGLLLVGRRRGAAGSTEDSGTVDSGKVRAKLSPVWRWALLVLLAGVFLGWSGLVAALILAVAFARWDPSERAMRRWCVALVVMLPTTWLMGHPEGPLMVTSSAVHDNLWPQGVAAALIVSLLVAVLRREDVLAGRWRTAGTHSGESESATGPGNDESGGEVADGRARA